MTNKIQQVTKHLKSTYKDLKSIEMPLFNIRINVAKIGDTPEARALSVIDEDILKSVRKLEEKIKFMIDIMEELK